MPELIVSARELRYAGKSMLQGERFEASEKDAKLLKAIRKAEDLPAHYGEPIGHVATTQGPVEPATPEPAAAEPPAPAAPVPAPATPPSAPERDKAEKPAKRPKYQTRDLQAED